MSEDIGHILKDWRYDPEEDITVRIVRGDDSRPKIQMRIEMGIMQMEIDGHPVGDRPQGEESWLDYFERRQREFEASKVDDYFSLDEDDSRKLRREGVQYYYRYLSLMKLEDYPRVIRDTDRNLRLFAFVKKYAAGELDRWALDQYRPYVIMMNTRARSSLILKDDPAGGIDQAIELFDIGIGNILAFYNEYGIASEIENSMELSILKSLKREFLRLRPQAVPLDEQLTQAIREERFEDAAKLRDRIREQGQAEGRSQKAEGKI
ncbi:MAG: UvrB/UvrC motif-containing protein [Candidatus Latescibacterota bacterium]